MNLRNIAWTLALTTASLQAHPGHQPFSEGAKHFVSSPSHLLPALVFSAALFVGARFLKQRAERNLVTAVAAVIALVAVLA